MQTVPPWAWWLLLAFSGYALVWFGRCDWLRLTRGSIRVPAVVVGHGKGDEGFMAVYAFEDEAGRYRVYDAFSLAVPAPSIGTPVNLVHPIGRPDLARRPRRLAHAVIYAAIVAAAGLAIASLPA